MMVSVAGVLLPTFADEDSLTRDDGFRYAAIAVAAFMISRGLAKLGVRRALQRRRLGSLVKLLRRRGGYRGRMTGKLLPITIEELQESLDGDGRPSTPDDVSITLDGRRLDSKEAILAWCAEVEADLAAGRLIELEDGTFG